MTIVHRSKIIIDRVPLGFDFFEGFKMDLSTCNHKSYLVSESCCHTKAENYTLFHVKIKSIVEKMKFTG